MPRPDSALPLASQPFVRIVSRGGQIGVDGQPFCRLTPDPGSRSSNGASVFVRWYWDGHALLAENDRLGFYPLFYALRPDGIALSPSLLRLLATGVPADLDEGALATFFRLGFFLGEDTPFRAVRLLPPGGSLRWTPRSFDVAGGCWIPRPQSLSREAAMDLYSETFRQAITEAAADGEAAVPLSGGRDSRHILLALSAIGAPPQVCYSVRHYPPKPDEDADIASRVSARVNVPHVVIPQSQRRLAAETRKNRLTHFCSLEHAWILALADRVAADGAGMTLYDGIGGDVLSAGLLLDERRLDLFARGRLEELAEMLLGDDGYVVYLLPRNALRRMGREPARARLVQELARHVDAANPWASFLFWNRTRRSVAVSPFGILHPACRVTTPFLHPVVYELLASLPATMMLDHQFHTETIARAFPDFADVPYERTDSRQAAGGASYRQFATDIIRYTLHTGGGILVRPGFGITRGLRTLVDPTYAAWVTSFGPLVVYALQLQSLQEDLAAAADA